jgi:hypothetical protein
MSNEQKDDQLSEAVQEEDSFVRDKLKEELGREPTAEEIDEWLREHTESY